MTILYCPKGHALETLTDMFGFMCECGFLVAQNDSIKSQVDERGRNLQEMIDAGEIGQWIRELQRGLV